MRILWICNVAPPIVSKLMKREHSVYGGWLDLLSRDIVKQEKCKLHICYPGISDCEKDLINEQYLKCFSFISGNKVDKMKKRFIYILNCVKPDIIHIFGTEFLHTYSAISACENVGILNKVVISIQGLVSICCRHYADGIPLSVVYGYSMKEFVKRRNLKSTINILEERGLYERQALSMSRNVIGRTEWDRACIKQINPIVQYYKCNETLRANFYNAKWDLVACERCSIYVNGNEVPLKGLHYALEAVSIVVKSYPDVKLYLTMNDLYKIKPYKLSKYQIYLKDLINRFGIKNNIKFVGILNENEMCQQLLKVNVFALTSSIENSPNSLAEAMLLGVPCVAADVGGVADMIKHNDEGFIYQHNAPYMLAHYICRIFNEDTLTKQFSIRARERAVHTHNQENNLQTLLKIYEDINNRAEG